MVWRREPHDGGNRVAIEGPADASYVRPAAVEMVAQPPGPAEHETFAPILYLMQRFRFGARTAQHSSQGLSSSVFTNDLREAEMFSSAR
ncbi:aldehyde dehydrogenase family protein [Bradyrhizobium sp. 164]|uniref:aldehyde dehydrogenase family protein n=1 Tax=Bradyrhizobium sp. 164 TaxID=2782637 RepID=UPI0029FC881B|nr:aldehyde dehydrogenase family protein [Bradyrhizobium sp. 164]